MALGSATNFVRQNVGSSVGTNDPETIDVADASAFPDPSTNQYDIVIWDTDQGRPDEDADAEVMTVTGRDTTNDTLTCARAKQGTGNTSHPTTADVQLGPLASPDFKDVFTESVTTEQGDITNETRVELESTSTQSISSATWETIEYDSVIHDDRNEWDGGNYQFSPDKTGTYDVKCMVRFDGGADGDARLLRFRNITNSEDVAFMQQDTNQFENFLIAFEKELDSAATYEFQARNGNSSDTLSGNTARTQASIRSSFREQ